MSSPAHDAALGHYLLTLARSAIATRLGIEAAPADLASELAADSRERLDQPAATFVTLTLDGQLRGCIGRLEASRPLREDVLANALAAAFADPRFPPLSSSEYPRLQLEISLLGPATPLPTADEDSACQQLRPGIDGVILEAGPQRATFLPQVWHSLPDPRDFLAQLKHKAGLPAQGWSAAYRLYRYQVSHWHESA